MKIIKEDKAMMEYLMEHPEYAEELIQEAEAQEIAAIEEKYKSIIIAYNRTKFKLHGLVAQIIKLEEKWKEEGGSSKLTKKLQKAHESSEKEWSRLSCEFGVKYGKRYDTYKRELADAEEKFKELRTLIISSCKIKQQEGSE